MDLHLQVDPRVSVSEGHESGCWVAASVRTEFDDIIDITVHIDPENDADIDQEGPSLLRPLRETVVEDLTEDWSGLCEILDFRLHYLRGKIDVELVTLSDVTLAELKSATVRPWLGNVSIMRPN